MNFFFLNCSLASPVIALTGGNWLPWRPHSCQISASQTLNTSRYEHLNPLNKIHTRGEAAHPRTIKVGGVDFKGFKFKHINFLENLKIEWENLKFVYGSGIEKNGQINICERYMRRFHMMPEWRSWLLKILSGTQIHLFKFFLFK